MPRVQLAMTGALSTMIVDRSLSWRRLRVFVELNKKRVTRKLFHISQRSLEEQE